MTHINELIIKYQHIDLPPIQKSIISYTDISALVSDTRLHRILNPCFSYHYCVAHVKPNGDVVTTKDTDGYVEPWGQQSKNAEQNAFDLAQDIRLLFVANGAYKIGKKYFIDVNGTQYRIPGMTTGNTVIN
jgi:hypothetical protein